MSLIRMLHSVAKAGGHTAKLIPGRAVIVITRDGEFEAKGTLQSSSGIQRALAPMLAAELRRAESGEGGDFQVDLPHLGTIFGQIDRKSHGVEASFFFPDAQPSQIRDVVALNLIPLSSPAPERTRTTAIREPHAARPAEPPADSGEPRRPTHDSTVAKTAPRAPDAPLTPEAERARREEIERRRAQAEGARPRERDADPARPRAAKGERDWRDEEAARARAYDPDRPRRIDPERPPDRPRAHEPERPHRVDPERPRAYDVDRPREHDADRPRDYDRPRGHEPERARPYDPERPRAYEPERGREYVGERPPGYEPARQRRFDEDGDRARAPDSSHRDRERDRDSDRDRDRAREPSSSRSREEEPVTPPRAPEPSARAAEVKRDPGPRAGTAETADMDKLLVTMVKMGASDLHLSAMSPPMIRKDGEMMVIPQTVPLKSEQTEAVLMAIAPKRNRDEFARRHDTDFAYELPGQGRFRVNVFRDRLGVGGVLRIIPTKIPNFEDLGLPEDLLRLCQLPKGLVLVTGPTGSGKSTTLAALVDYMNRTRAHHIITIEDPIEFVHMNKKCLINQRQVGEHTDSFKDALRAALREDPDILLVGEMRDLETIAIAIETAETGHLVFGTLHTSSAPSTVDRIIDQFPSDRQSQVRVMLSESLRGVICQMLCKKIGGGRIAALEVLMGVPAVSNLIREGKVFQLPSIMQTGRKIGMRQMNDSLLDLVVRGVVEPQEALSKTMDRNGLASILTANNIPLTKDAAAAGRPNNTVTGTRPA